MKPGTQAERLFRYLQAHPGASSLEIQSALAITNCTGRLSDLRDGYSVLLHPVQGELFEMAS